MKRIAVLEPDEGGKKQLTRSDILALVGILLKSKGLQSKDRKQLELLKLDLVAEEMAEGITEFISHFLDDKVVVGMIVDQLGVYATRRLNRRAKTPKEKKQKKP